MKDGRTEESKDIRRITKDGRNGGKEKGNKERALFWRTKNRLTGITPSQLPSQPWAAADSSPQSDFDLPSG
jgi:hypothetical protein